MEAVREATGWARAWGLERVPATHWGTTDSVETVDDAGAARLTSAGTQLTAMGQGVGRVEGGVGGGWKEGGDDGRGRGADSGR